MTNVPTRAQRSIRWCQSRPLRARREASMQKTAPIGNQLLEAWPLNEPRSGAAKIVIDNDDRCEADCTRRFGERVLTPLALGILRDLPHGRLAHIDHRPPTEVVRRDLRIHRRLLLRFPDSPARGVLPEVDRPRPAPRPLVLAPLAGTFSR